MVRSQATRLIATTAIACAWLAGPQPAPAEASTDSWHPAAVVGRFAFPVLLPADGRWLNWRNTYGAPRMRLIDGVWKQVGVHQGIDIYAERGSPIVSMSHGRIENLGWTFYSGNRVGVRGDDGRYYFYAHLLEGAPSGISVGARVAPGRIIGYLGSSGYGPPGTAEEFPAHLHLGVQAGGWIDPNEQLLTLYAAAVGQARERERATGAVAVSGSTISGRAFMPGSPLDEHLTDALDRIKASAAAVDRTMVTRSDG